MSLLIKSNENKNAFIFLKERNSVSDCNSPAIHCCYYSCFQKIVYTLEKYFTPEYESIEKNNRGTHNSQINTFLYEIRQSFGESINTALLSRSILQLRSLRTKSDYSNAIITNEEVDLAGELLNNFHNTLNKAISYDSE